MLESLNPQPQDKILQLIALFRDDPRTDKIDLGVGVYKDASGQTPVMRAVKTAERKLWETETSKTYTALAGEPAYNAAMVGMILGAGFGDRAASISTPGGTGAIRQALELIRMATPDATVWLSNPTWPNHPSIIKFLGMKMAEYRYFDAESRGVDFAGVLQDLAKVAKGDVVLLHGCCHNPTGADYSETQWDEIAETVAAKRLFPLIDLAYHGLGHGFEADGYGLRAVLSKVPEALIAYSCDKNFGLYRERVGALYVMTETPAQQASVQSNLAALARANWSMPPDHGAASVRIVLEDEGLTKIWLNELESMRARMRGVRDALAAHQAIGSVNLAAVGQQNGLFSVLQLGPEQIAALRADWGVYMAGSGRINIAGFTDANIPHFIEGLRAVTA